MIKKIIKDSFLEKPARQIYGNLVGQLPPRLRYGKVFWDTYKFLQESQWWSREKLEHYQLQQLSKLLRHAYENIPYYRRVLDERGLRPGGIQDFDELRKLPYLTKEIIQENLSNLIARNYPKSKLQYVTTGGSTGIPLGFYWKGGVTEAKEQAFIITLWNRVGFNIGDRCVVLRGNVVHSANEGKFWEYDPLNKNLILSSYHMTDKTLPEYIEKIRKFKPDFIQAYPSAITILARFMRENNIKPFSTVKAILCASENLYSWQRELLEEVMKCRVWSFYGHAERAALAGECEKSSYYHIQPEYGIVELINKDGNPVTNEDKRGEIVATGFNNFVCPFIRYRTGDLAVPLITKCECGRNYALLKSLEGRLQELTVTKAGNLLPLTGAYALVAKSSRNIIEAQFYQQEKGQIILNVVKERLYIETDTRRIRDAFYKRFGNDLNLIIRFVDHIPRTKSGKYRFLIQKLPIEFRDQSEP